ncbi:MAG: site-specific DNA-methyltransferase [Planctomycetes bacterium]|nr:site-specific DNA-methyltransferase [Planctomycetota bacterium]
MASRSKKDAAKGANPAPVDAIKHQDRRPNIPTGELRDFVREDEASPATVLYPRDPSLDPQLVWKGKDEQDRHPLEVPAVPIYIQEKIHPQAIVEDVRRSAARRSSGDQMDLFGDFNGLSDFDKKVDFYHHDQHWSNRMILGDSLLVMTSLAEKEGFKGKVQTVFMDPPYGIKFGSNWQVTTRRRDIMDGRVEDATRQPEQIRAFRDTWQLGVHSYLSYLRDRLVVARELLSESGSVFVQIGADNVHLVRCVLDEVFGSANLVSQITFAKTSGSTGEYLAGTCDFVLLYAKTKARFKFRRPYASKDLSRSTEGPYSLLELPDGSRRRLTAQERGDVSQIPAGARVFRLDNLQSQAMGREKGEGAACCFPVRFRRRDWRPGARSRWKTNEEGMARLLAAGRVEATDGGLYYVRYFDDFRAVPIGDQWTDTVVAGFSSDKKYVVETSTKVVDRCICMTTDPGDIVLDPTCGSGTTAFVAEERGRRWIAIDTSRVALTLARARLMTARYPYYLLADSVEGREKLREVASQSLPKDQPSGDVRRGLVCRRVTHVKLEHIARNPEIREGMSRPEIDAAIARHADTEILHDQPYEDAKRVRVTGPFTVESLSPHRVQATDESVAERPAGPAIPFESMILDNLRKAGVQNTVKKERLVFDSLEPFAGAWLQGAGDYTDKDGKVRRVAVSIGPEHGTVAPQQVKEAAKEAVRGVGFDLLIVCGFAFDPHVSEETRQYGKLTVLTARMNPDLTMGEELLKKTGAGNLFMVFGEPDIEVRRAKDGKIVVRIRGLDVYDPTTGQVRSSSIDPATGAGEHDIACWFIDTDYDGESFFVRHAYFTGADEPYEKLQRALRAEVDESAWQALYSTESRPFTPPSTGRIAVKVINHYGDEVMKVLSLAR